MSKSDVLLIGSGISSLTAGLLLAKQNKSVVILEQHTKIGGYLHCFERFGHRFDTGAHYIGSLEPGQSFHTLMNYLGVWNAQDYVALDKNGFDELCFPDFQFSVPRGYEAFEQRLCELAPHETKGIQALCKAVRTAVTYFSTYDFNDILPGTFPEEIFDRSLAAVVNDHVKDKRVQNIFYTYCTHHGATPEDIGFGFHAVIMDTLISGAYGFAAGGEALAARYKVELERLGARILTRQRVTRLEVQGRQIAAVHTERGDRYEADWVISSIHPKHTMSLIDDRTALTPLFQARVNELQEGPSFFGIYGLAKNNG